MFLSKPVNIYIFKHREKVRRAQKAQEARARAARAQAQAESGGQAGAGGMPGAGPGAGGLPFMMDPEIMAAFEVSFENEFAFFMR